MQFIRRRHKPSCESIYPLRLSLPLLKTMAGEFNGVRVHADVFAAQSGSVQITACALSLKEVITGMEMKGDLKECTAVGS